MRDSRGSGELAVVVLGVGRGVLVVEREEILDHIDTLECAEQQVDASESESAGFLAVF